MASDHPVKMPVFVGTGETIALRPLNHQARPDTP